MRPCDCPFCLLVELAGNGAGALSFYDKLKMINKLGGHLIQFNEDEVPMVKLIAYQSKIEYSIVDAVIRNMRRQKLLTEQDEQELFPYIFGNKEES